MIKLILTTAVLSTLTASVALADEKHHSDPKSTPVKQAGMTMDKKQENMLRMHEQMHKIMEEKDPKKREQLMQEHQKMMHEHMGMMHGNMMGDGQGGMMGSGKMDTPTEKHSDHSKHSGTK